MTQKKEKHLQKEEKYVPNWSSELSWSQSGDTVLPKTLSVKVPLGSGHRMV